MTSILDMKKPQPEFDLTTFFLPLKYLLTNEYFDKFIRGADFNYLVNAIFWIFLVFASGFALFSRICQVFLRSSPIKYYKRQQFVRAFWNIAFYAASSLFLHCYNEFIIIPQISNQGRFSLFFSSENAIFHQSQQCEKFQFYSLFIITFYLHGAILDCKETDYLEGAAKTLYLFSLVAIDFYKYETYFVGLNLSLSIYNIVTEMLSLLSLQNSNRRRLIYRIFLVLRIVSWSYMFINLIPFKYLVPTLFAKNCKLVLNAIIWLWYGLSIWNSPVLQCFYHQIYHNTPTDCAGEGSAAKCILLRESSEYRHYKLIRKAYLEVKQSQEKRIGGTISAAATENASAKAFQAIKCVMLLKRKLKRIREGNRNNEPIEDGLVEDMDLEDEKLECDDD